MGEIAIISLTVFALHYCFQDGEIFGRAQRLKLGWWSDPLRDCPVCMTFWWGSGIYWTTWHAGLSDWLLTVIPALGLNAVLVKLFPDKDSPSNVPVLEKIADSLRSPVKVIEVTPAIIETIPKPAGGTKSSKKPRP